MPSIPGPARPGPRQARHLLTLLTLVTAASAAAMLWLGWNVLQQDRDVAAQRAQERLEAAADRVVRVFDRRLGDIDAMLAGWLDDRTGSPEGDVAGGAGAVFTRTAIEATAGTRLAFHPVVTVTPEVQWSLFTQAEAAEFKRRDLRQAMSAYRRLAQSTDHATRAAALMRLGRAARAAGQHDAALGAYREMAALEGAHVIGLPADLVARSAEVEVLQQLGAAADSRSQAASLVTDLAAGRWRLARGQYEHYIELAARAAGQQPPAGSLAVAAAIDRLWEEWKGPLPARGRRLERRDGAPLLVTWMGTSERLAAWVVEPPVLMDVLQSEPGVAISLSDDEGPVVTSDTFAGNRRAIRTAAETRLPWTLHIGRGASSTVDDEDSGRAWFVGAGLVLMMVVLGTGALFIGRAVKREIELARLQSDFVSAVSHEFRTPLAAMRQLSELLAEGRVVDEAKRHQYFQSLAGESRRLQRLVENLLNFGRLDSGAQLYRLEPVDPRSLVEGVVAEYRSQLASPECQIEVDAGAGAMAMLADRDAVALAVHNLIDNAVKYSGRACVHVAWERRGDRVAVSVRDEGPGIAADERQRIFQKFVRGASAAAANVRGTGLGLAMVQLVAAGHGGSITVDSTPGAGATFTLLLPAAEAVRQPGEEATA